MNTYEAYVTGVTGRRLSIQAENQKAAEIEALREFTALVGADDNVEVVDITRVDDEPWYMPHGGTLDIPTAKDLEDAERIVNEALSKDPRILLSLPVSLVEYRGD